MIFRYVTRGLQNPPLLRQSSVHGYTERGDPTVCVIFRALLFHKAYEEVHVVVLLREQRFLCHFPTATFGRTYQHAAA